ncbi:MAG: radical SAM protein [Methanoregula sp.]|jgi:uncharacterized protein|uniref:radical SAM/SPASM domain-containing protein n=1 Tax=Methanoregula sp. TaxID=2052170 RepID=UPI0025DBCA5D|nr:radical SAM protein [Methanoregula sp.]MCK9631681.1 radical SAM protein [Methanoregula sp.]
MQDCECLYLIKRVLLQKSFNYESINAIVKDKMLKNINEMHLYVTSRCNMNCSYCSDVIKRTNPSGNPFMDLDIGKKYVELIFSNSTRDRITIVFHGGEPTLQSLKWYQQLIEYIEFQARNHNKKVNLALQSNCMRISDEFIELFNKNKIIIGASLDGPPEINDLTRVNGEVALSNILRLQAINRLGGVICVITDKNCNDVETILRFFEKCGLNSLSFNIFYSVGEGNKLPPLSAKKIFEVYKTTYEYMRSTSGKGVKERSVSIMISKFLNPLSKEELLTNLNCYSPFCHAGIFNIICDTEGNLFPCGCSDVLKFKLGTIHSIDKQHYVNVLKMLHKKSEKYDKSCSSCFANSICSFSCPAFHEEDPITERNLCEATKIFYQFLEEEPREIITEIASGTEFYRGKQTH